MKPQEIITLAPILRQAGKNQYMIDQDADPTVLPAFMLASAKLMQLNGRKVVSAWGNFHLSNEGNGSEFFGIYIDRNGDGAEVWEVFFQANDKIKFLLFLEDFEAALKSIVWY